MPDPLTPEALETVMLKPPPVAEANQIRDYMAVECADQVVTFIERITSERVFDRRLDVWDVHTNAGRYWVITNPTLLYSQQLFPSLDFTLTVHVGLTTRMMARREGPPDAERAHKLTECWRRWAQAAEAADHAEEAEDFQAVGMRCREVLLSLVRHLARPWMVPKGKEPPKAADFLHWSERAADGLAEGSHAERVRGYLKARLKRPGRWCSGSPTRRTPFGLTPSWRWRPRGARSRRSVPPWSATSGHFPTGVGAAPHTES